MSTYLDLDSSYRNAGTYPNPCDYVVDDAQTKTWFREPRIVVNAFNDPALTPRVKDYAQSVNVERVILPYTDIFFREFDPEQQSILRLDHMMNLKRIYLDVHNPRHNDTSLISSIDNKSGRAKFVLFFHEVQNDVDGNPICIHYKSKMDQVYRLYRNESLSVTFLNEENKIIVVDDPIVSPSKQTYVLLGNTPYSRDGNFTTPNRFIT